MNFKKFVFSVLATAMCTGMNAQVAENVAGRDCYRGNRSFGTNQVYDDGKMDHSDILACPENTVCSNPFTESHISWAGFQCSDMRRADLNTCFYQSFKRCFYTVDGLKFNFILTNYDQEKGWINISENKMLDEEGNFKEPLAFDVAFYESDENGLPSTTLTSKRYMIKPEKTSIQYKDPTGGFSWVYSVTVQLDKTIAIENGWFSACAADTGEGDPGAWVSFLISSNAEYPAYVDVNSGEDILWSFSSLIFCLTGPGDMLSNKSLRMDELVYPGAFANGKYEKVTTTLMNAGATDISDATLEVWEKGNKLFTEKVDVTIPVGEDYVYTFKNRIDCTEEGTHEFTIKNVTPGDENLCASELTFTTTKAPEGQAVESVAEKCDQYHISQVEIGDIDNESEASTYSDFKDFSTTIHYGEELKLKVAAFDAPIVTVWVDWNEDGIFSGEGEHIGSMEYNVYQKKASIMVTVPDGVDILPGKKTLRLISAYNWTTYSGTYPCGETEDYTLVLERNAGLPELAKGEKYVVVNSKDTEAEYVIKNEGAADLDASFTVTHMLPDTPSDLLLYQKLPETTETKAIATKKFDAPVRALATDNEVKHVLGWDHGMSTSISLGKSAKIVFAQYYPGVMIRHIGGMQINSVDFVLSEVPEGMSIVFYEGDDMDRMTNNKEVYRQDVNTAELEGHGWQHVVLDTPYTISDKGLFACLEMRNLEKSKYYVGIDGGGVLTGYGDLMCLDGRRWETLTINGLNRNFNIRCNVVGEATPAISWISKKGEDTFKLAQGEEGHLKMNVHSNVKEYFYEAMVEIVTNDELRKTVNVPVYLICSENLSVGTIKNDLAGVTIEADASELRIISDKAIADIALYTVDGAKVLNLNATGNVTHISKSGLQHGIYVVRVIFENGTMHNIKVPVL